jgi:hypothetical protein
MIHHAWKCEQRIVLAGLVLVTASMGRARETPSRLEMDRQASGADRIALSAVSSGQNPSEPQETTPQLPPPSSANTVEKAASKSLQVTYEDGQLSIIAENSALSDVMKALRAALGMDIDLPASVAEQRVWVHLGPGPARRVLRDLLDSTEFNYVIQASESDADGIRSVFLTQRSKSSGSTDAPGMAERAANRRIPRGRSSEDASDSDNPANAESVVPSSAAAVSPSVPSMNQPPTAINPQNATPSSSSSASGTGSSVAEQMVQQLQSMYQQRRQIQMQQNQKPTGQN